MKLLETEKEAVTTQVRPSRFFSSNLRNCFWLLICVTIISSPNPANAAGSCPTLPGSQSTFASTLSKILGTSSSSKTGSNLGDPVSQLNSSQRQKFIEAVRAALNNRRVALDKSSAGQAASARLKRMKQRIFAIDRVERTPSTTRLRGYDREFGGSVRISRGKGKSLGHLIDLELAKADKGLAAKYSTKYKKAILDAIIANPAKAGEFAGALSSGDYMVVADFTADWGAQQFGTVVSDYLTEKEYTNTKVLWSVAVRQAGGAKSVMQALAKGDRSMAWTAFKAAAKSEGIHQSKAVVKSVINTAFNAGNGTGTIGTFVRLPQTAQDLIAPGILQLTPGDIYVKMIEAEIAMINWGKNYLRTRWKGGDGQCIKEYNISFKAHKNSSTAYEAFSRCSPTAGYSAMFEFGNKAAQIGLNKDVAIRQYLEAQRISASGALTSSLTPIAWIDARIKEIKAALDAKVAAAVKKSSAALDEADKVLKSQSGKMGSVLAPVLQEIAASLLNEKQWGNIEAELKQLEKLLDQTMSIVNADLKRAHAYGDGVSDACKTYWNQRSVALQALKNGRKLSRDSVDLWERMINLNTSICKKSTPPSKHGNNNVEVLVEIKAELAKLVQIKTQVCTAAAQIRAAADKDAARAILKTELANARLVQSNAEGIKSRLAKLQLASSSKTAPIDQSQKRRADTSAKLAAIKGEIETLAGKFGLVNGSTFVPAHKIMAKQYNKATGLTTGNAPILERIEKCLKPLLNAPVAENARAILKDLSDRKTNNNGCSGLVADSWDKRDLDPDDGSGFRSSRPWRRRNLSMHFSISRLRAKHDELASQCPDRRSAKTVQNKSETINLSQINKIRSQVDKIVAEMQRCVAEALQAFQERSEPDPQILAAATALADPASLVCDVNDISRRITQLRQPKYSEIPNLSQKIAVLVGKSGLIAGATADLAEAKNHFQASKPGSTRRALQAATAKLDQLNGVPTCPKLRARIARGEQQTAELDRILSAARGALNSCNPRQLQAAVRAIGKKRNVPAKLARARARMERQLGVLRLLRNASRLYNSGDLKGARRLILQARNLRSKSGSRDCPALDQRVDNALTAVARQQGQQEQARLAANSCDTQTLAGIQRSLKKKRGKFVKSFNYQITKSMKVCKEKDKDRQAERDREEREESLRAAGKRQATCREKYGVGYRPGKMDSNGKYYCLPSKRTANAWCQNNNTGNGWRAVKFTGKGGYSCRQSRRVVASAARADCRRQYGNRYSHTVVKRSGRYTCHFCPRGHYARKGRCYNRRATARRTPKYTCPRGYYLKGRRCYPRQNAADVARVIGGILGAISNNRGQPRARGCPRGFVPDGRKCYRCGAGTVARNGSCVSVSNRRRIQKRRKSRGSCGKTIYRGGIPMTDTC